jgi:hypothetical protein
MNARHHQARLLKSGSLLAGVGLAAVIVVAALPRSIPLGPASARFALSPSAELGILPLAPRPALLTGTLSPGSSVRSARFSVRNQTPSALRVQFTAQVASHALDQMLIVRLTLHGGRVLADGSLQRLISLPSAAFVLARGRSASVTIGTWLPVDVDPTYAGQHVDVQLTTKVSRAG